MNLKSPRKPLEDPAAKAQAQHERFKDMAREVGADESPEALDRAFAKLDPKKRPEPVGK